MQKSTTLGSLYPIETLYYYLSRGGGFEADIGPFMRVQNVYQLFKFSQESAANSNWTYSVQGPFKVLGKETIDKTIKDSPNDLDKLTKLNESITCYCREWFEKMRCCFKNSKAEIVFPPSLNPTTLYDSQKMTLIQHCFLKILNNKADFSALDRLIKLGVDINSPVTFSIYSSNVDAPPLIYLWSLRDDSNTNIEKIKQMIKYLIEKGASIHQTFGPSLDNMMGFWIKNARSSSFLQIYQEYNGDLNYQNKEGNSLLHIALYDPNVIPHSQIDVATLLVKAGIDVTLSNNQGDHAIHLLCHYGYYSGNDNNTLLKAILENSPKEVNVRDGQNLTPLNWCIRTGKIDLVETIKAHQADIYESTEGTRKYLEDFIEFTTAKCREFDWSKNFKCFTEEIVRKNITEKCLPLLSSILPFVGKTKEGLRDNLIAYDKNNTTLLHSLALSCPWILSYLLDLQYIKAEDLKLQDGQGITVEQLGEKITNSFKLMIACSNLDKKTAFEMLEKDVFLNLQIQDGQTYLHVILYSSFVPDDIKWKVGFKIFKKLLEKKANPNLVEDYERTSPLLWAIGFQTSNANAFMLELLNYGADPGIKNKYGTSARDVIKNYKGWELVKNAILGAPYIN